MRVATDSSGNIYVTSSASNRVQKFTSKGDFITGWGSLGSDRGRFNGLGDVAVVDSSGNVYVADTRNRRIQKFSENGEFFRPFGLALDPNDRVIVADSQNFRVQVFAR